MTPNEAYAIMQPMTKHISPIETAARSIGYGPAMTMRQQRERDIQLTRDLDESTFADVHKAHRSEYGAGTHVRGKSRPGKLALGLGVAATFVGAGILAYDHFTEAKPNPIKVVEHSEVPQGLPSEKDATIHITQPNETAIDIASQYKENSAQLADQIHEAAKHGEDPGLDPGDRVIIPKE